MRNRTEQVSAPDTSPDWNDAAFWQSAPKRRVRITGGRVVPLIIGVGGAKGVAHFTYAEVRATGLL